jgi:hypothetical protein
LPQGLRGRRNFVARLGEIALEEGEPRLADQSAVGLDRDEVEPVALERRAAETTGHEVRTPHDAGLARRIVDAQAGPAARRDPDFLRFGSLGMQHRQDEATQPQLLGIRDAPAAGGEQRHQHDREAEPTHAATIRECRDFAHVLARKTGPHFAGHALGDRLPLRQVSTTLISALVHVLFSENRYPLFRDMRRGAK